MSPWVRLSPYTLAQLRTVLCLKIVRPYKCISISTKVLSSRFALMSRMEYLSSGESFSRLGLVIVRLIILLGMALLANIAFSRDMRRMPLSLVKNALKA